MFSREYYIEIIRGKLAYIYGKETAEKLLSQEEKLKYTLSSTGRVRHVHLEDKLMFTLRIGDGYLLPTIHAAEVLSQRVVISDDAVPFVRKGYSVMAKSILKIEGRAKPGMDVVVTSRNGEVLAVGRLLLSEDEIRSVKRGIAVKVRSHVEEG